MTSQANTLKSHGAWWLVALCLLSCLGLVGLTLPCEAIAISEKPVTVSDLEKPNGYVQDYAGILSDTSKGQLNALGKELEEKTGAQFVVVVIPSLNGADLEGLTLDIGRTWGVGQKKANNGLVFLVAINDRKMRAEIGYGLEGIIPDGLSGEVQRQVIRPYFKESHFEDGIKAGMFQYASLIAKDSNVTLTPIEGLAPIHFDSTRKKTRTSTDFPIFFGVIILFVILSFFNRKNRGNRQHDGGMPIFFGGFGGGGSSFGGGDSFGGFGGGDFGGGGSSSDW